MESDLVSLTFTGTDPALSQGKRKRPASFITAEDGRLVIEEEEKRTVDRGDPLTGQ